MTFEDLVGMELTHKKFGKVKVIELLTDYADLKSTKMRVQLQDRIALFNLSSLLTFFTDVPQDILDDVGEIIQEKSSIHIENIKQKSEVEPVNIDEFGSELSIHDWKRSKKYVTDFWWSTNDSPAPVVMNNKKVFMSARAACKYLEIPISNYYEIYKICNGAVIKKVFNGYTWRFAKKEEIDDIIKNYEQ